MDQNIEKENSGAMLANAALTSALIRTLIDGDVLTIKQAILIFQIAIVDLERMKQGPPASNETLERAVALLAMGIKRFETMN